MLYYLEAEHTEKDPASPFSLLPDPGSAGLLLHPPQGSISPGGSPRWAVAAAPWSGAATAMAAAESSPLSGKKKFGASAEEKMEIQPPTWLLTPKD